ncbi:MAG TPA: dephospho-CoA kinase [Gemmatimonadaceae bacterium]|nr:dephospho-CoA kinase [Gemmatimonadaceae bacterium]
MGLTGNIASGKSEAATRFAERGATIVDADVLAREAVAIGAPANERVVARWGKEILAPDGTLDREALRHTVFADPAQLEELNAIVHPGVNKLRRKMVAEARKRGDAVLIYVVPLLFERRLAGEFDQIILVDAPQELRLARLVQLRGVSPEDAANMISAQMPAELKRARANFVIENDGSLERLDEQVDDVWSRLTASATRSSLAI